MSRRTFDSPTIGERRPPRGCGRAKLSRTSPRALALRFRQGRGLSRRAGPLPFAGFSRLLHEIRGTEALPTRAGSPPRGSPRAPGREQLVSRATRPPVRCVLARQSDRRALALGARPCERLHAASRRPRPERLCACEGRDAQRQRASQAAGEGRGFTDPTDQPAVLAFSRAGRDSVPLAVGRSPTTKRVRAQESAALLADSKGEAARRRPGDASTAGSVATEARSEPRRHERPRASVAFPSLSILSRQNYPPTHLRKPSHHFHSATERF
jgi:hypothetical protein